MEETPAGEGRVEGAQEGLPATALGPATRRVSFHRHTYDSEAVWKDPLYWGILVHTWTTALKMW